MTDREANRFSARAARYARVGANMSGVAARLAGARLFGLALDRGKNAIELAASLGQVHRARAHDGDELACKLQYPDMQSAVEADLRQLQLIFAIHRRMDPVIDTTEIAKEIGARILEELDYHLEARHVMLYRKMLDGIDAIRVPRARPELSTGRLLTLDWLQGRRLLEHTKADLAARNRLGTAMFTAWWWPFSRFGVIHGDPHLGNYSVFDAAGRPAGVQLFGL